MKIAGSITSLSEHGDEIRVEIQGRALGQAAWRPTGHVILHVPSDGQTKATYRLDRLVTLEVTPS